MKLPNADTAIVETSKISGYLLNMSHPDGRGKARFFIGHGYDPAAPEQLAGDLKEHGRTNDVAQSVESPFGVRYTIDGLMKTPDGRDPLVRTVWIVESGHESPRLVTAHPVSRGGDE